MAMCSQQTRERTESRGKHQCPQEGRNSCQNFLPPPLLIFIKVTTFFSIFLQSFQRQIDCYKIFNRFFKIPFWISIYRIKMQFHISNMYLYRTSKGRIFLLKLHLFYQFTAELEKRYCSSYKPCLYLYNSLKKKISKSCLYCSCPIVL